MSRRWVVDASPLILLGKIGQTALLGRLADQVVIPDAVAREVSARAEGERTLSTLASFSGAQILPPVAVTTEIEVWDLGRGESQVLALSAAVPGSRAVLDDLEARRCAQALGLPVIGTLGIVLRAKRLSLIEAAAPVVAELRRAGLYVADDLVVKALSHLGEDPAP